MTIHLSADTLKWITAMQSLFLLFSRLFLSPRRRQCVMWASNSFAPFDPFTYNTYFFHYNILWLSLLLWFATTFGFLSSSRWDAPIIFSGIYKLLDEIVVLFDASPVFRRRDVLRRSTYRKYRTCAGSRRPHQFRKFNFDNFDVCRMPPMTTNDRRLLVYYLLY